MANIYTWVPTHKELANELTNYRDRQSELVRNLEEAGVDSDTLIDEDDTGRIRLQQIDPFTFYCLIHKHGNEKRLKILQNIAQNFGITVPEDVQGIPTVYAQKAMLFPFQPDGRTDEIERL